MSSWLGGVAVFPRHWIWDKEPVYHLQAELQRDPEFHIEKTRCGIVLYKHRKGTNQTLVDCSTYLLRQHADKFARPCKRCLR